MDKGRRQASLFRTEHISPQVDTLENRFVKFTLKAITRRLEAFAKTCETHPTVSRSFIDDLFEEPDPDKIDSTTLSALTYTYPEKDGVRIELRYQQNYGESGEDGDLAYYNPQRPDIVLVIERGGETYTYLFDAKYRIDTRKDKDASPSEPINDMHRYRDAILYRSQGEGAKLTRQIIGAYVLYPGRPKPQSFDCSAIIAAENIGAIELLPGEDGSGALRSFLQVVLARKDASEHLGSVIPTQGTHVVIGEGFTEADLFDVELAEEMSWRELFKFSTNRFRVARASVVDEGMNPEELHFFRVKYRDEAALILRVEYDAALSTDEVCVYGIRSKEFYG